MSSVGTLFAIVNRQSKAVGGAEWKLYRKAKSGKPEDRQEVTSHAALDLWNRPNPYFNQQVFAEAGAQHKLLTGEQWWVVVRRGGMPLELWPVRPDRIEPVPDPEKYLTGYLYYGPAGEQVALRKEDVIFIRTPSPLDPYRGIGPVQSILMDLDATRYSAEWNRNFFLNSAEPGGVVEVERNLDDQEFDDLTKRWNEQHKGVANAHRVALLEGGMKWVDRSFSQRDMQFVELRSVSREVIREAYGMPKAMLGTTEDVNRANAEAGEAMFARWLVVPELEAMKAALNSELLSMFGATTQGLEFDYESPVPEDVEAEARKLTSKAEAARALRAAQFSGPDVLQAVGLPEMSGVTAEQELLVDIVRGAPTLAPVVLPLLGYDLPEAQEWQGSPLDLADLVTKLAAGVGSVLTVEEARRMLADAGAPLDAGSPPSEPKREPNEAEPGVPSPEAEPEPTALMLGTGLPQVEDARRWKAVEVIDDNTCGPCRENHGTLYRNRADAYEDYPGGEGYVHCVGERYGNSCRGKVVKRRGEE
nr:phage portal protein [Streptomyces boncukensis]